MPVSVNEKPGGENKPVGAPQSQVPTAPSPESQKDKEASTAGSNGLSVNDSRLNNQVNCYGDGPNSGDSIEAEVAQKRAERLDKINEDSSDVLAGAAASGDADVHNLLGQRTVAEQNGDEEALKRIDEDLANRQKQTSVSG